jgi:hypothetical protein
MRKQSAARVQTPDVHGPARPSPTVSVHSTLAGTEAPLPFRKLNLIPDSLRQDMIREAAYFRAEARGFIPGREREDWLLAEQEINEVIIRRYG